MSSTKRVSVLDVYKLLPKTNCKMCGEPSCMAFATKLVNRTATLSQCPPLLKPEYKENYEKLVELLRPPVKELVIGIGKRSTKVGGKLVMYRHEFTYTNPTAIVVDVADDMSKPDLLKRIKAIENFKITRVGQDLRLDAIAIRNVTGDPKRFASAVETVVKNTKLPVILCSFDPRAIEQGLGTAKGRRPLIYAATRENWEDMARLATAYKCPLVLSAPGDVELLRSLSNVMKEKGFDDIALDPGTQFGDAFGDTVNNFTMIRRAATAGDRLLGFPLVGVPLVAWMEGGTEDEKRWREAYMAASLITRYADLLIVHGIDVWELLPLVTLRQNIYTDPRKPSSVDPGLKEFGKVNKKSPVMLTTNFTLTYYTVANDIEGAKVNGYLLVADTGGLSVASSIPGRKLTAEVVADLIKETGVEKKVSHRKLIIPGLAARLRGDIEEKTGWKVILGPADSSGIPKFLKEKWKT